jgi:hypothetical protein
MFFISRLRYSRVASISAEFSPWLRLLPELGRVSEWSDGPFSGEPAMRQDQRARGTQ